MRVAVIVVTMLTVTTSSEASQSCMSKSEARQHFGSVHIYWHGPDHCWDATALRHRQVHRRPPIREVQRQSEPKWHDAMSMLPHDEPGQPLATAASVASSDIQRQSDDAVIGMLWVDRWIDVGPSHSPLVARPVRIIQLSSPPLGKLKSAPLLSTHDMLLLAFIVLVLTLEAIGSCTGTSNEPRKSERS